MVKMKYSFEWEDYRKAWDGISEVEEKVIFDNFKEMLNGSDFYIEMPSSEINGHYDTFKHAWICRGMFSNYIAKTSGR
jgi:hypothetical protein